MSFSVRPFVGFRQSHNSLCSFTDKSSFLSNPTRPNSLEHPLCRTAKHLSSLCRLSNDGDGNSAEFCRRVGEGTPVGTNQPFRVRKAPQIDDCVLDAREAFAAGRCRKRQNLSAETPTNFVLDGEVVGGKIENDVGMFLNFFFHGFDEVFGLAFRSADGVVGSAHVNADDFFGKLSCDGVDAFLNLGFRLSRRKGCHNASAIYQSETRSCENIPNAAFS